MASLSEIRVPDLGGFSDVSVIDVLVKEGEQIEIDTPLITLETEKATMDVPSPQAGRIAALKIEKGGRVSQGSVIALLEPASDAAKPAAAAPAPEVAATLQRRRRNRPTAGASARRALNSARRRLRRRPRPRRPSPQARRRSRSPISRTRTPVPPCASSHASWA